jgi:diguanylate cyclase (GGDEF)-like protein
LCVRRPAARTRGFSECYGEERTIVENAGLGIYAIISKWGFPKTYRGKIMLVAFLGIHAPLLGAALYLLLGSSVGLGEALRILALLVAVTLVGTAATLLALGALLAPVRLTSSVLKGYLDDRTKPDLPIGFSDEVGTLMADVRYAVEHLDSTIRSLEGLSGTDHLTDLPNRREGEDRLANDIARARRGGGQLTLAVVDLDDFKTINDTHGHHAGDVCIRHVADVIGRSVREGDWLCRWGGDEFVLALWDDDSVFASPEAVLGRINAELRRSPVRLPGGEELVLSISVGAHRYAGEDDLRELLAKADGAMYQAKREGRAWVLAD